MAARPGYRSSPATLRRLVTRNLLYEAPGTASSDWDRFHIRNLGLASNRRMAGEFGGDAARLRATAERKVARALRLGPRSLPRESKPVFREFALALDLVPDLSRWSRGEREAVVEILRAKAGPTERRYLRLMRGHPRLRAALVRAGSAPRRSAP